MIFWGDVLRMPKADEYRVRAVAGHGHWRGVWRTYGTFSSRVGAMECVERLVERGGYTRVGIEPHASEGGTFQTHPLQEVWVA